MFGVRAVCDEMFVMPAAEIDGAAWIGGFRLPVIQFQAAGFNAEADFVRLAILVKLLV